MPKNLSSSLSSPPATAQHSQPSSSSATPDSPLSTTPINHECKMKPNVKITQHGLNKEIAAILVTCFSPATYQATGVMQFFTTVEPKLKARLLAFEQALYPFLSAGKYNQLNQYQVEITQIDTSAQGVYITSHIAYQLSYRLPSLAKPVSETGTLTLRYQLENSHSTLLNIQSDKIDLDSLLPLQPGKTGDSPADYPIRGIIERKPEIGIYPPPDHRSHS